MTVNWTSNCYIQQRNILTVSNFAPGTTHVYILVTSPQNLSALYAVPSSGVLQIDLSDLVRAYISGNFTITERGSLSPASSSQTWTRAGLIKPNSVLVPESELFNSSLKLLLSPPQMMLRQIGTNSSAQTIFEMYSDDGYQFVTGYIKHLPSGTATNFANSNTIAPSDTTIELWHLTDASYGHIELKELLCGHVYAAVQWVSYTGIMRRHTFEVIKQTTEAIDVVGIETINNEYEEHKGRADGFTLRLEGLSRYDFWYYSDLITSSDVQVSFDGVNWTRVQVVSKKAEIPSSDESALHTLEIAVNYKKYDTI